MKKESNKLTYTNINWIVTALNNLEFFWIDKRNNAADDDETKICNDIIKEIRETEVKIKYHDCF